VLDTLTRLQLDCVDSMQVHDPEFAPSVEVIVTQTLPALQRLKEEGRIKYVGITGYPLETQREIIERSIAAGTLVS
jgi:L-galactose dehydrogenase